MASSIIADPQLDTDRTGTHKIINVTICQLVGCFRYLEFLKAFKNLRYIDHITTSIH